jgi:hypothetical protein
MDNSNLKGSLLDWVTLMFFTKDNNGKEVKINKVYIDYNNRLSHSPCFGREGNKIVAFIKGRQ